MHKKLRLSINSGLYTNNFLSLSTIFLVFNQYTDGILASFLFHCFAISLPYFLYSNTFYDKSVSV